MDVQSVQAGSQKRALNKEKKRNEREEIQRETLEIIKRINQDSKQAKSKLDTVEKKVDKIQILLDNTQKQGKESYAEILKRTSEGATTGNVQHAGVEESSTFNIMIKPKSKQSHDLTRRQLKEAVDIVKIKAPVKRLENISNGGILIRASSQESQEKILREAEKKINKEMYEVTTTKKRHPKIRIANLDKDYNDTELQAELISLNHFIDEEDEFRIVHKKTYHIKGEKKWSLIVEVSGKTFRKVIDRHIHLGYKAHYIKEDINIIRCFNCQLFGHRASNCANKTCCAKCAGEHHNRRAQAICPDV